MNSRKKILIIAESLDVENSSGAKGRVALIENLKQLGFNLIVFHYTRKEITIDQIPCIQIKEKKVTPLFVLSRIERQIRYHTGIKLGLFLENFLGFSFTLFNDRDSIVSSLMKNVDFDPDLVVTLSQGGSFRPHHSLLRISKWHCKWLAYIHDPYPMYLFPEPYTWKEPGYRIKLNFIKEVSEKAAFSAFPSKLLMDWMGQHFPKFLERGIVIPHQISAGLEESIGLRTFSEREHFDILHAGNLLWGRNPEGLINGFLRFLNNNSDAKKDSRLIFVGSKNHYTTLLEEIGKENPQVLVISKQLPFSDVINFQKMASVNVILEAKGDTSPFLPGKFPHCVLAEKPILLLGPEVSESRRLMGESYKFWSKIDDEVRIAELFAVLYSQWKINFLDLDLKRNDLKYYLSPQYLEKVIVKLLN